jgi:hypothetical protein
MGWFLLEVLVRCTRYLYLVPTLESIAISCGIGARTDTCHTFGSNGAWTEEKGNSSLNDCVVDSAHPTYVSGDKHSNQEGRASERKMKP